MKKILVSMVLGLVLGFLPAMAMAVPAAPTVSYSATGLSLTVAWTPVSGATGYTLAYAPYPWMPSMTMDDIHYADMGKATNISFHLWEGAAYSVAVLAYDAQGGVSDFSNIEDFIMGPPTPQWVDNDGDGYHENSGDCNDSNSLIGPDQPEICGDGIDQDCDSVDQTCASADVDNDVDGYIENQGDCNDSNAAIHPGATEICGNAIDEDCNGNDRACLAEELDNDLDGYTEIQGDCNDGNPAINPGATDICEDGIDQNCSGVDSTCAQNIDDDLDGYTESQGDCNDSRGDTYPGAMEICGDGIDQDCTGSDSLCAETAVAPLFAPSAGTYSSGQKVVLTTATPGAQIRYTFDGSTPTRTSILYSSPIAVNTSQTIKAIAYLSGMNISDVSTGVYAIIPSLTGTWAIVHTTGFNTCGQTVGEQIAFNAAVEQTGSAVTVTTAGGSGSGTLNGNKGTWTTTQPVNYGSINGTLTFNMNVTIAPDWNSFSGPTSFTFTDGMVSCSGTGTIAGTRVQ